MSGFKPACKIRVNAAGDWEVVPPAGQITQIGNAGGTSHGLVANDDLFVSGKLEVNGITYFDEDVEFLEKANFRDWFRIRYPGGRLFLYSRHDSNLDFNNTESETTIPVGQGAAGINTINFAPANSIIVAVVARVTVAPGGGATTFSVGRTGGNIDEFVQNRPVALGTLSYSSTHGDGVNPGPVNNGALNSFVITTDADVLVSDMKVRIIAWTQKIIGPTE